MQRLVHRAFAYLAGSITVGAVIIVLTVAFASVIYAGPLSPYLDGGIGTTLLGATAALWVGAFLFSYRGTIPTPRGLTVVLLAGAAAQMAAATGGIATEALFASVLMLLALSACLTGVFLVLLGRARLSVVVRFIPYPVKGGFLAATGYLLVIGAIGIQVDTSLDLWSLGTVMEPGKLGQWVPWLLVGAGMLAANRLVNSKMTLPLALATVVLGFYAALAIRGVSLAEARAAGLLLGPFGGGTFLADLHPATLIPEVQWSLILDQGLTILAVVAMTILGSGLSLSAIEMAVRTELDIDRDMMTIGIGALAAAPTGGVMPYPGLVTTVLGDRLGLGSTRLGLGAGAVCLATALGGAELLAMLPRGLFSATLFFIGLDLLVTWFWSERRRLLPKDYSVVLAILAISAMFGFLEALAVGLALSILLFVISYSSQSFLRQRTSLAVRRSSVERSLAEVDYLTDVGATVVIYELGGYLFFGSAASLRQLLESELTREEGRPGILILDFANVQGVDPTAADALFRIAQMAKAQGVRAIAAGMRQDVASRVTRFGSASLVSCASLDEALRTVEEELLAERGAPPEATFYEALVARVSPVDPEALFSIVSKAAGTRLIEIGKRSDEMYILLEGAAHVTVEASSGRETVVARLGRGALIGEIGYFGDARRSADVILTEASRLLRIERAALDRVRDSNPAFVAAFLELAAQDLCRRMERSTRLIQAMSH